MKYFIRYIAWIVFCFSIVTQAQSNSIPLWGTIDEWPSESKQNISLEKKSVGPLQFNDVTITSKMEGDARQGILMSRLTLFDKEFEVEGAVQSVFNEIVLNVKKKEPVTLLGIPLQEIKVTLLRADKSISIRGFTKVAGLELEAGFDIVPNKKALFVARLVPDFTEWHPFPDANLKELKDIKVTGISLDVAGGLQKKKIDKKEKKEKVTVDDPEKTAAQSSLGLLGTIGIVGQAHALGVTAEAACQFMASTQKDFSVLCGLRLPEGWKLSQSFPELFKKGDEFANAIDLLKFDSMWAIVSTQDATVDFLGEEQSVSRGINLGGGLIIDEEAARDSILLRVIRKIIVEQGVDPAGLHLEGVLDLASLRTSYIKGGISSGGFGFKIGPTSVYDGGLVLTVRGDPGIGLQLQAKMKPTEKDQPLSFATEVLATPINIGLSGSIKGIWKDPLGIKGFEFGNMGITGTQTYTAIAEAMTAAAGTFGVGTLWVLIPAEMGVVGETSIGKGENKFYARLGGNIGKNLTSLAFTGQVKEAMTLVNLVQALLEQMGAIDKVDLKEMIPLVLHNIKLHFAPLGTRIGEIPIKQGIAFESDVELFDKRAHLLMSLDLDQGLVVKGEMDRIEIGALKFTGAKGEGKPIIDTVLGWNDPRMKVSGRLELFDLVSDTDIEVSLRRLAFDTHTQLADIYRVALKGSTIDVKDIAKVKPEEVSLEITIEDGLAEALQDISSVIKDTVSTVVKASLEEEAKKAGLPGWVSVVAGEVDKVRNTGLLKEIGQIGLDVTSTGDVVVDNITDLINIDRIHWKGSLDDANRGMLVAPRVEGTFFGKKRTIQAPDLDLRNPDKSIKELLNFVAKEVSKNIGDVLKVGLGNIKQAFENLFDQAMGFGEDIGKELSQVAKQVETTAKNIEKEAHKNIKKSIKHAEKVAEKVEKAIEKKTREGFEHAYKIAENIVEDGKKVVEEAYKLIEKGTRESVEKGRNLLIQGQGRINQGIYESKKVASSICVGNKNCQKGVGHIAKEAEKVAEDADRFINERYDEVANFAEDRIRDLKKAGNWIEGAAKDTEKWVKGAAKDTEKWAKGKAKDTGKFFEKGWNRFKGIF